jgi:hypothetical protein
MLRHKVLAHWYRWTSEEPCFCECSLTGKQLYNPRQAIWYHHSVTREPTRCCVSVNALSLVNSYAMLDKRYGITAEVFVNQRRTVFLQAPSHR